MAEVCLDTNKDEAASELGWIKKSYVGAGFKQ